MRKYVTIQGDMWDGISLKHYGTEKAMDILIDANPQYRETFVFGGGVVLFIPDVDTTTINSSLPPWKRKKI